MDIHMAEMNIQPPLRKVTYRRPLSRAERIRIRNRRKRIARRRQIKRWILRVGIYLVFLVAAAFILSKAASLVSGLFLPKAYGTPTFATELLSGKINTLRYEVDKPAVIETDELKSRLLTLAEKYPEFQTIYDHADIYPDRLLAALCSNPEMIDFVKGYPDNNGSVTGGLTQKEADNGIPHLLQWDKRWGYAAFGDNNIALSGCAPTCLSMVIVGLTGNINASPDALAEYAMANGFYVEGTGTAWSLMTQAGKEWGVCGRELPLLESRVMNELEAGNPIICSVGEGDFTTLGHFIVLTGITDGKIRVNDPNSISRSQKLWDYSTLEGQISNLWVFTLQ